MATNFRPAIDAALAGNPYAGQFGFGPKPPPPDLTGLAKPATPRAAPKGDLRRPVLDLSGLAKPASAPVTTTLGEGVNTAGRGFVRGALEGVGQTMRGLAGQMTITPQDAREMEQLGLLQLDPTRPLKEQVETRPPQELGPYKLGETISGIAQRPDLAPPPGWEQGWTDKISGAFGSTAPFLAAGATGAGGSLVAGTILGMWSGAGQAMDDAVAHGATAEQILQAAHLGNVPGATETLPMEVLFQRVPLPAWGKLAGAIGHVLATAAAEGTQESTQQFLQNVIAKYVYNPDQDLTEGLLQAGALGAIVGGGAAGAGHLVPGRPEQQATAAQPGAGPLQGEVLPPEPSPAPGAPSGAIERPTIDLTANRRSPDPEGRIDLNLSERDRQMRRLREMGLGMLDPAAPPPALQQIPPPAPLIGREGTSQPGAMVVQNRNAQNQPSAGAQQLPGNAEALRVPEAQILPPLRGAGDSSLPAVAGQLPSISGGYGTAPAGPYAGAEGQREGLQSGQLPLDSSGAAVAQPPGLSAANVAGTNPDIARVGEQDRGALGSTLPALAQRLAGGENPIQRTVPFRGAAPVAPDQVERGRENRLGVGGSAGINRRPDQGTLEEGITSRPSVESGARAQRETASLADLARVVTSPEALGRQGRARSRDAGQPDQEGLVSRGGPNNPAEASGTGSGADLADLARPIRGAGVRQSPAHVTAPSDVARAEAQVAPEPSPAQAKAGNYAKGHIRWNGLPLTIETATGGTRRGTEPDGTPWEVPNMPAAYGYFKRSRARDGDQVDAYIGPSPQALQVFVLDQIDPETGRYDEAKALVGFSSPEEARQAYEGGFSDGRARERIGAITAMPVADFKRWLKLGKPHNPFNAKAVAEVRRARQEIARNQKSPEAALPKRPLTQQLIRMGGVDPASPLAGELRHMGIKVPGLYRKGGQAGIDNWPLRENGEFGSEADDGHGYVRPDAILEGIREEHFGRPLRAPEVHQDIAEHAAANPLGQADEVALDATLREHGLGNDTARRERARFFMADGGMDVDSAVEKAIMEEVADVLTDAEETYVTEHGGIPFDHEGDGAALGERGAAAPQEGQPGTQGAAEAGGEAAAVARQPEVEEPQALDFEIFAAQRGASRQSYGDAGLHSGAAHVSRRARKATQANQLASDQALAERRSKLRLEYDAEVAAGRFRPLTSRERLEINAAGPEDSERTQAARRVLAKRDAVRANLEGLAKPATSPEIPFSRGKRAQEAEYYRRMQEKDRSTDIGPEGKEQNVLPGAEREANKSFLQRKADAPLKPKAEQKAADQGLFGDGHKQKELFSPGRARETAQSNALAIIKQVAGDDVAVNFADKIYPGAGNLNMSKWWTAATEEAAGSANKLDRIIAISLNPEFETDNTAYHEAYHLIEDLKTRAERDLIRRELPRLRKMVAKDMGLSPEEVASVAPSEIEAQAFAAYAQGKDKGMHVGIRAFFAKLLKIIRRIRNMMQGLGFRTVDDYYDAALRGEVQARGLEDVSEGEQFSPGKRREPAFYSAVVRSVENAKITKGTPDQWMGYLKNQPGVKQDELDWLGVQDWLAGRGSVTKEALADFVRANQVEVQEVEKGAVPIPMLRDVTRDELTVSAREHDYEVKAEDGRTVHVGKGTVGSESEATDYAFRYFNNRAADINANRRNAVEPTDTKFASYQLPGGSNYRELLLTLPHVRRDDVTPSASVVARHQVEWDALAHNNQAALQEREQARREMSPQFARLADEYRQTQAGLDDLHNQMVEETIKESNGRLGSAPFTSSHWDEPNVLAHVRFNEREVSGKRVLFIEEVQSDWHQKGRKQGYNSSGDPYPKEYVDTYRQEMLETKQFEGMDLSDKEVIDHFGLRPKNYTTGVPDAPFKTTWPELAMKRMVRFASEQGFDELAWTPGDVQAERYDLSKQIESIEVVRVPISGENGPQTRKWWVTAAAGHAGRDLGSITTDGDGKVTKANAIWGDVVGKHISDVIGKELAEKGMAVDENQKFTGVDLKVGGEGMRGFYDRILPSVANKLGKKFGAKVGTSEIDASSQEGPPSWTSVGTSPRRPGLAAQKIWSLPITPAMREAAMQGQPLFSIGRRPRRDPTAFFDTPEDRIRLRRFLQVASLGMLRRGVNSTLTRRRLQDRAISMRDMQDAITAAGGTISEDTDLYLAESLYYGRTGERIFELRTRYVDPLVRKMAGYGIDRADLDEFLYALHATERNAAIRQRDPANTEGSGMSDAEARAILQRRMAGNQARHYLDLVDDVKRIVRRSRETLFNAGLISQDTLDSWENAYANYVPLRGWEGEEIGEGPRSGRGFDVRGPEAHAATGRHSRADSPLAYTIMQAQQSIIRAEKNRVAQMLGRLAVRYRNKQVWEVNKVELKKRINPSTGLVEEYWLNPQAQPKENIVIAKSRGKATYITVHHEGLLNAMRMSGAESMGRLLAGVGRFTRVIASLYTTFDPDFVLRNLSRDTQEAMLHLSEHKRKGLRRAVLRDMPAAATGMFRYLRGDDGNAHAWLRNAREFAQSGGKISFFNQESLEDQKRALDRALSAQSPITALERGRPDKAALAAFHAVGGFIEDINGSVENAIRLSIFVNLRRAGISQAQAASAAREITVNFNRKGEWSSAINVLYLFSNATVQGGFRQAQFAKRSPRTFMKAALAMAVLGAGADWLNYILAGEDPKDGMNFWDKVPDYDKQRNFIIMQPGTGKYLFKFPMLYGYNIWPTLGASISAAVRHGTGAGKGMEPIDAALNVLTSTVNAYSPLDLVTGLQALVPTALSPLVEIWRNKDWKGSPITPPKSDEKQPNADLFYRGVNPLSKEVAKELERYTTYDARKPAVIDISPEWIDHIWGTYMGGAGQFWVNRIGGNIYKIMQGEPVDTKDIPFLRTFRGEVGDYVNTNIYYNLSDDVLRIQNLLQDAHSDAERRAVQERYPVESKVVGDFVAADRILGKLRRVRKQIENNSSLSPADRDAQVKVLLGDMTAAQDRARAAWEKARKQRAGVAAPL